MEQLKKSHTNYVEGYQDTGIYKGVCFIDVHQKRHNNKEGFQNRVGGFHQHRFEMIRPRRGQTSSIQKPKHVDDYQDTGISRGVYIFMDVH